MGGLGAVGALGLAGCSCPLCRGGDRNGKIVAKYLGEAYGTDALLKNDGGLDVALKLLEAHFGLATAGVQLYKSQNQVQNFFDCVRTRRPTISPAEVGGRGSVLCQLCNMSYVYDTGFEWDPVNMTFANGTGDPVWARRAVYRNGWDIVV